MKRRGKSKSKSGAKKKTSTLLYAGLLGAGVVAAILFWPKKASAASSSFQQTTSGGPLPSPTPAPVAPVKGEVIIQQGSHVNLLAPLNAHVAENPSTRLMVPAGTTITIEDVNNSGDILFKYAGQVLTSPVEDYTAAV